MPWWKIVATEIITKVYVLEADDSGDAEDQIEAGMVEPRRSDQEGLLIEHEVEGPFATEEEAS
jgi:hypothetical protein